MASRQLSSRRMKSSMLRFLALSSRVDRHCIKFRRDYPASCSSVSTRPLRGSASPGPPRPRLCRWSHTVAVPSVPGPRLAPGHACFNGCHALWHRPIAPILASHALGHVRFRLATALQAAVTVLGAVEFSLELSTPFRRTLYPACAASRVRYVLNRPGSRSLGLELVGVDFGPNARAQSDGANHVYRRSGWERLREYATFLLLIWPATWTLPLALPPARKLALTCLEFSLSSM